MQKIIATQTQEKNKMRLTALDICALVNELKQTLIGMRVANIYNCDQKTYVFKFSKSEQKQFLIIENGVRFNLTSEQGFTKSKMPSGFTMKFRRYLRSRRLEAIEQIGIERVVVLTFGVDEHRTYLILELYSQGNIIMADKDYRIIQLTRQHQFSEKALVAPNEIYPFEYTATNYIEKIDTSAEHIEQEIDKEIKKKNDWLDEKNKDNINNIKKDEKGQNKKKGKYQKQEQTAQQMKMKEIIFKIIPCLHTSMTDDLIRQMGYNPNEKVSVDNIKSIKEICDFSLDYLLKFRSRNQYKGYLIAQSEYIKNEQQLQIEVNDEVKQVQKKIKYFEFVPELAQYHQGKYIEEKQTFNEAVEKYFTEVERTEQMPNIEEIAWRKFQNIKQDQESRIQKLKDQQDEYQLKAYLIEYNINDVEAVLNIIKKMVDGKIQWDKIAKMIGDSKKEGDQLANLIHDMDFMHQKITILLGDHENDEDELIPVELDLTMSAYQNQRFYYGSKKKFEQKEGKTKEAAQQALKQAEQTAQNEIEREKLKYMKVMAQRKKYWFEKFYWFITSDGLLVISGRDVQQNELLVKKYLGKNDLYMHADMYGSTSTIIKNPKGQIISDNTLMQAATATMCRSKAWESKIVVGTWWVYANQVSKSAPAGLYVGAGSFMIYGKKNFVYPQKLEMGYTILYALDQESLMKHAQERKQKYENQSELITLKQEDTEIDPLEQLEKNVFDSDDEDQENNNNTIEQDDNEEKSKVETIQLTQDQIKQLGQTGIDMSEVTIVEVNPNARKIQEKHNKTNQTQQQLQQQQKKQDKQQQKQQQVQSNKGTQNNKKSDKTQNQEQTTDTTNRQVRGRQGKLKKMQDKYGEQSDEEKEILMRLMGAKQTKEMKQQKKNQQEEIQQDPNIEQQDIQQYQGYKQKEEKSITQVLLQKQNMELLQVVEKATIVEQEQNQQNLDIDIENDKDKDKDNKISSDEEEEKEKEKEKEEDVEQEYEEIQKIVSYLYPDDKFVSVVPMCGPYQTMSVNKFKIKINPGTLKKGKAAKDITNFFMSLKEATGYEKKLIKQMTDEEIVGNLLNGVKLTGQGMLMLKQKQNQAKKLAYKKQNQK